MSHKFATYVLEKVNSTYNDIRTTPITPMTIITTPDISIIDSSQIPKNICIYDDTYGWVNCDKKIRDFIANGFEDKNKNYQSSFRLDVAIPYRY